MTKPKTFKQSLDEARRRQEIGRQRSIDALITFVDAKTNPEKVIQQAHFKRNVLNGARLYHPERRDQLSREKAHAKSSQTKKLKRIRAGKDQLPDFKDGE